MTISKNTYKTYKNSGIEWIGVIPQEWTIRKLFGLLKIIGSGTTPKGNDSYYDGDIPWLNTGDLTDSYINIIGKTVTDIAMAECSALKLFDVGSVVIAMYGATIGKLGILTFPTTTNQACCVMSCGKQLSSKYLFYILYAARDYILTLSYGAGQPNISQETMKAFKLCCPNFCEQQQIADYLDKKCGEIDKVVETEKTVIEKLKEYKQSIITEAVTKGLDKSVPLKDSGIEWIGKISQDWKIARIKYNYYLKGRIGWQGLKASEFLDEGAYLITGTDFCNGRVNWDTCYHISEERYNEAPEIHVQIDDLLITKDGTVGKVAYIDNKPEKVSLNSHLLIIRPNNKNYKNKFLYWVIQSEIFEKYYQLSQNGTIMASLSQEKISNFSFALPDPVDQIKIAIYLDKKCSEIDKAITGKEQLIEKLTEYKKSLIYECVTGKRKVV